MSSGTPPQIGTSAVAERAVRKDLPVPRLHKPRCGPVKPSRRGRVRALVLIALHVAILAHIAHWKVAGKTLTPLEPSEAMQTLELGYLNAGFILFCAAILATLVFGRFFCGWACHVVAYQDLCAWLLQRMHLRPKPVRSRLLVWIPAATALYMFVWPQVKRLVPALSTAAFPGWVRHFMTEDLWATFPGPWIAALTFAIDGFLIVYLLGAKGFCTYGCPYGAVFGAVDRFASGRIRVTDACEGCGHCTATCTSNVRVHEEVARFGMVVDSGCMKCLDCVSVCPKEALYFGFGSPRVAKKKAKPRRAYDFSWPEEIAMAAVFLASFFALRGLYGAVPLFLAIGLAVIAAVLVVTFKRLLARHDFAFQQRPLRAEGRLTGRGRAVLVLCVAYLAFILHSAVVQYDARRGAFLLAEAQRGALDQRSELIERSRIHLERAERLGLFARADHEQMIGSILRAQERYDAAQAHLMRAIELNPDITGARVHLADILLLQGDVQAALGMLDEQLRRTPDDPEARKRMDAAVARGLRASPQ